MATTPLQLEELIYERVMLETNSDHDPDTGAVSRIEFDVHFGRTADDPQLWRVELTVEVTEEDGRPTPPYELMVCGIGFFRINPDCPADLAPKVVAAEGTAVIYSSVRELVLTLTGRAPWGSYLLPSVSLGDLEPQRRDEGDETGSALIESLAEYGPLSLRELATLLDINPEELRPVVKVLVENGILIRVGRGRGTRYHLAELEEAPDTEIQ